MAHRTIDVSPARRPGPPTAIESHRALRRAVARIDASFHERVALDRLARHAPVTCPRSYPQQVGMAFSEDLTRVRLRRETRDLGGTGHRIAQIAVDSGVPDVKALNTAFRPHLRAHAPAFRRLLTADAAATGSVFHQQHYASHHDETVMRAPRTWAARATTDETAPCAMTRGSDPVETHRRSRWYYGLSSAVDTGGRLLCNRFGHAPPE